MRKLLLLLFIRSKGDPTVMVLWNDREKKIYNRNYDENQTSFTQLLIDE
jgi:hypothetical protein